MSAGLPSAFFSATACWAQARLTAEPPICERLLASERFFTALTREALANAPRWYDFAAVATPAPATTQPAVPSR